MRLYKGIVVMGLNWFKKIKLSNTISKPLFVPQEDDPEVVRGPQEARPKYYKGMRVRDRRKGVVVPQEYGRVDDIRGDQIKIVWNIDDKEKKKEEIFNMVEDTEVLSLIVAEV